MVHYEEFFQTVVYNIRQARWAAGMTQEDVAGKGFTLNHYQEIEAGLRQVTLRTLYKLASIFGVSVSALVEIEGRDEIQSRVPLSDLQVEAPKRGRKAGKKA